MDFVQLSRLEERKCYAILQRTACYSNARQPDRNYGHFVFLTHRAPFILAQCLHDAKLLGMDFPLFER